MVSLNAEEAAMLQRLLRVEIAARCANLNSHDARLHEAGLLRGGELSLLEGISEMLSVDSAAISRAESAEARVLREKLASSEIRIGELVSLNRRSDKTILMCARQRDAALRVIERVRRVCAQWRGAAEGRGYASDIEHELPPIDDTAEETS